MTRPRRFVGPEDESAGVPRRFGLATLLLIMTVYAALFSVMKMLGTSPIWFVGVTVFVTGVIAAPAVLFRGREPVMASAIAGAVLFVAGWLVGIGWLAGTEGGAASIRGVYLWAAIGGTCALALILAMVGAALGVAVGQVFNGCNPILRSRMLAPIGTGWRAKAALV